jgi:hypothetical protein
MGKKKLLYSEEEIWALTPRKFFAMLTVAIQYDEAMYGSGDKKNKKGQNNNSDVKDGYIDKINW